MQENRIIVPGSSNKPLATHIAKLLCIPLAQIELSHFPCSESRVHILTNLENKTVYIVQSTSAPANDHLVELMLIIDAAKRMKAKKIICVIPWFGYAPQDKVFRQGEPLSSIVVVAALESIGVDGFIVCDIHSPLVLDMFTVPVLDVSALPLFVSYIKKNILVKGRTVVAALDKGSAKRSQAFAKMLGVPLVVFDKSRDRHTGKITFHKHEGVIENKHVITFDDYTSTGQTLIDSAKYLKSRGALSYVCCVTHIIVYDTLQYINESVIDTCLLSNTIHFEIPETLHKIKTIDISRLLVQSIKNTQ